MLKQIQYLRQEQSKKYPYKLEKAIKQELNGAIALEKYSNVNPVYQVVENFKKTFESNIIEKIETSQVSSASKDIPLELSGKKDKENDFYSKFGEQALNNGKLVGGIINEESKPIFVSILKRTLTRNSKSNEDTKKIFSKSKVQDQVDNLPIHLELNRYTNEAAGIVLDALMSAGRFAKSLKDLIEGKVGHSLGDDRREFLFKMYPFLTTQKEEGLLEEYTQKLELLGKNDDPTNQSDVLEQQAVLKHGIIKTTALINKKKQMTVNFISAINELLTKSQKAQEIFSRPSFVTEVVNELEGLLEPPEDEDRSDEDNEQDDSGQNNNGQSEANTIS